MSWFSKLFGGGAGAAPAQPAAPVEYNGYLITPEPIPDEGQFRLAGWVTMEVNGETRKHHFIRADLLRSRDEAEEAAVIKGKQMIDQMGPRLFD